LPPGLREDRREGHGGRGGDGDRWARDGGALRPAEEGRRRQALPLLHPRRHHRGGPLHGPRRDADVHGVSTRAWRNSRAALIAAARRACPRQMMWAALSHVVRPSMIISTEKVPMRSAEIRPTTSM